MRHTLAAFSLILVCAQAAAEDWLYTVRPGDQIWNIATKYCGSHSYAARIISYNQLADERAIRSGSRLRIPIEWLVRQPVTAEILNVRGPASLWTPEPIPAEVGGDIEMGDRLTTTEGTVVVGFADGSTLTVAAQSEVLFNVMTAFGDTGMVDTNLRFYKGRGTSRIIRRNDASRFRISSPVGTAAVRGTVFRFAVSPGQSLTETLEGEVGFLRDTETSVPAGFGVAASTTDIVKEALLPAPTWSSAPGQYATDAELSWEPVTGAVGYRASIYLLADPQTPVQVQTVTDSRLPLQTLSAASYTVAVRAISASDLEGYESQLAISLGTTAPRPNSQAVFDANAISLSWMATTTGAPYTLEIAENAGFADVVNRESGLAALHFAPPLSAGHYHWRVKDQTSTFSPAEAITIRPVAPEPPEIQLNRLALSLQWSSPGADSYALRISRSADFSNPVIQQTLTEPKFADNLPAIGMYYIEVVAIANGIRSTPTIVATTASRPPPWWLLGLLLLPVLL